MVLTFIMRMQSIAQIAQRICSRYLNVPLNGERYLHYTYLIHRLVLPRVPSKFACSSVPTGCAPFLPDMIGAPSTSPASDMCL
jgi:hypothetical protein